ncbi:MAG: type II secretion system F family protein [Deltaproteobacteria bacterium]|nr:type II secretion system F family protein [Deltaproteobacteria bacterium]
MPLYHYRASDAAGNVVQGSLEAREERLVVQHLQQGGLIPIRISPEEERAGWLGWPPVRRRTRVPFKDLVLLTRELASLLKAGLPLDRSLKALLEVTGRPALKVLLTQILRDLQAGKSLSEALARHSVFSSLYISMVEAGEMGGFLDAALARVGEYLEAVHELRTTVATALIYPAILATAGTLSILLMLLYVVPRFELFFAEMGQSLYFTTEALLMLSRWLQSYWWAGLALTAIFLVVLHRLRLSPKGRLAIDRLKLTLPLVGRLNRQVTAALFGKTLGTLLKSGVPLVGALKIVQASVTNRYLAQFLPGVLAEVEKGQRLSAMLKKVGLLPEILLQLTAVGEETGQLGEMLLSAADSLEAESRAELKRLLAIMEPALIITMTLIVAVVIISLLLPVLNLYEIQF